MPFLPMGRCGATGRRVVHSMAAVGDALRPVAARGLQAIPAPGRGLSGQRGAKLVRQQQQ
jgi:hypothetical protein